MKKISIKRIKYRTLENNADFKRFMKYSCNSYTKIVFKAYKKFFIIFFSIYKMRNNYYQKHKVRLKKGTRERYQNLSNEEKSKAWKMVRERYQNFSEVRKDKRLI